MMKRNTVRETVLYYTPGATTHTAKLKGVLVQMGIRIRNVTQEQAEETVGVLLGRDTMGNSGEMAASGREASDEVHPLMTEEVLVMDQFSGRRIDELLLNLRKAGVPKIDLKAVVTESNIGWTFYHLYQEIKEEHEKMQEQN